MFSVSEASVAVKTRISSSNEQNATRAQRAHRLNK